MSDHLAHWWYFSIVKINKTLKLLFNLLFHIVSTVRIILTILPMQLPWLPGWPPSCRNKIPWLFPDQIQFFTDQNTAVLRPVCLLAADKWQIPFTSSLNCTSLILQMKEIKSLNSVLVQNVLKLTSFHSLEQAREKISIFIAFQVVKIPATTHILGQNYEIPWLFPDFLCIWNFLDQFAKFPDFSLTLKKNQISLTFPWPVATLTAVWYSFGN